MVRGEYWWVYCRSDRIDWSHRLAGDPVPVHEGTCEDPAGIPAPDGANLVLCIPGEQVRIHLVKAPARNRRRFIASLPFVLEDKLLHSPEAYHFVPLETKKGLAEIPVAVVNRKYLEEMLERFRLRDWCTIMAVPDYLYIEEPTADTWILDVTEQPLLLRNNNTGMGAVLAGELSTRPPGSLILALEQAKTMPQVLQVRVKEAPQSLMIKQWSETLEAFSIRLDVIEDSFARSRRLARPAPPSTEMNLLTGKFTPRGHARSELSRFHPALRLAAGLILVLITHWFVEGAGIRSEFQGLQAAIEQTYKGVFPDARNLVDPRYQMEQQLIKARVSNETTAEGNTDFLSMLEKLADVLGAEGHEIQALEFDGASMVMDVSVKDYESLERLQQELAATMRVTVENADLVNGRVNTRLSVEVGI